MSAKRHIVVVTTTRAEWGLLQPLVAGLEAMDGLRVTVLAGGSHLLKEHGDTLDIVRAQTKGTVETVSFLEKPEVAEPHDMARAMGLATTAFADAFARLVPSVAVVLGDRFEILSAAAAAVAMRVPLVHIEGGHVTMGAVDDRFRHAISKLADLHFVALPVHRDRILALGEAAGRVHVTGALGADNLLRLPSLPQEELQRLTGFDWQARPVILVTYHPETMSERPVAEEAAVFLDGLARTLGEPSHPAILFTAANLDPGGNVINEAIARFCAAHPADARFVASLGARGYISAVRAAAAVAGNSSSGVLEAPLAGTPVVNVGDRQQGRDRYGPVTDVPLDAAAIAGALAEILRRHRPRAESSSRAAGISVAARMAGLIAATDFTTLAVKPPLEPIKTRSE